MKQGVLGGTFDPVHTGHLVLAEEVKKRLNLDEVLFIPAGQPCFKKGDDVTAAEKRVEMTAAAIAQKPYFRLSRVEVERSGPSYTVDTLAELKKQLAEGDELYFIMGWDNLADLPLWREPERIIKLCSLVAVPRVDCPVPDMDVLETKIPGISKRVVMLNKPEMDISASVIRERVAHGLPISHLVPEAVAAYIEKEGLYR